jgi:hypothetical protein
MEEAYGPSNSVLRTETVPAKSDDASAITTRESDRVSAAGQEVRVADYALVNRALGVHGATAEPETGD